MRRAAPLLLALALWGTGAPAQDFVAEARAGLEAAAGKLERARGAAARMAALAEAVQAHEHALAALRAGLRRLATEDRRLSGALLDERARLTRLLGALQALAEAPRAAMLAYPGGPVRAARAAGLMGAIAPALEAAAAALATRLDALRTMRLRQEVARAEAGAALAALQDLRGRSLRAARGGASAPDRAELRRQAAAAAARADGLAALAAALAARPAVGAEPFADLRGRLIAPVAGRLTGEFGGIDPWGRTGQGVTFTAPAYATVAAPVAATVRYAGPLADYGLVVVLEPAAGWLMVLAGLGSAPVTAGETVLAGERLGDLGGPLPASTEFLLEAADAERQIRTETLYVELRHKGEAVDPAPWFAVPER